MNRRVLIVSYFYPPLAGGGVHRVLGFTRHLPRHGWSCTVVCAGPRDYWVTDATLTPPADTEVLRVPGGSGLAAWLALRPGDRGRRSTHSFGMLRALANWWAIPDSYAPWARRAGAQARRRVEQGGVDVLLTTSPPDSVHLAAKPVRAARRIPWVADFRDPWMSLALRRPPTAWHRRRQEREEAAVLRSADRVLAASRTHADALRARFAREALDPARVVHLPNGYEPEAAAAESGPIEDSGTFVVGFTGTMALMPDVMVFLDAVHELLVRAPDARRRLRVRLAGPYERGYEDRAIALGLTPGIVEFMGAASHAQARALQRRADALVHWQPRAMPTMVPGKLYEYAAARRPILAFVDPGSEAADLVRSTSGVVIAPGDRAAMTEALVQEYQAWREHGRAPDAAAAAFLDEHQRERLAGRLAAILDGVVTA